MNPTSTARLLLFMGRPFFVVMSVAVVLSALLFAVQARAHSVSDSQLQLDVDEGRIEGTWRVLLRDLDLALRLDTNGDRQLSDEEVENQHSTIADYLLSRLTVRSVGTGSVPGECAATPGAQALVGQHIELFFRAQCPQPVGTLSLRYELFFEHDISHRGMLRLSGGTTTHVSVFTHIEREQRFEMGGASGGSGLLRYLREGIWHIWVGYDHLLFLVTLLLPAVLVRRERHWEAEPHWQASLVRVGKVVTAFTLAHSLTLALAAYGWVAFPARWVETTIAISVAAAAVNNVRPFLSHHNWRLAFAFGLVHGFGFASVLGELGLHTEDLVWSLLGFNLGVEVGQLAVVALVLPVLFVVRTFRGFRAAGMPVLSGAIAVLALFWAVQRGFERDLVASPTAGQADLAEGASAYALMQQGRYADAAATLTRLQQTYAARGDAAQQASVSLLLGDVRLAQAELEPALALYQEAADAFDGQNSPALAATAYRKLALATSMTGDETRSARYRRRALELALIVPDELAAAADAEQLAAVYRSQKRYDEAVDALILAERLYANLGDRGAQVRIIAALGHVYQLSEQLPKAAEMYASALAHGVADAALLADLTANSGNVARRLGDWPNATRQLQTAVTMYERLGDVSKANKVRELLGRIAGPSDARHLP